MSDRAVTNRSVHQGQEQIGSGSPRTAAHRLTMAGMVIGIAAAVLLMVWGRAFYGSAEAYRKGEESLRQNRLTEAITYFDRAVHWYAPLNPYVERSAQMLWDVSETAEKGGDHTLALAALTSLKSGYVAAAGLSTPGREWIRRCKDRMESLSKAKNHNPPAAAVRPEEEKRSRDLAPPPSVLWTLVLEIGLLGWIGWTIRMITRFHTKERSRATLLKWGVPLLLFYAAWIVGMRLA